MFISIFLVLLILNITHQVDKENALSGAEDSDNMDISTPESAGSNVKQFLRHKITVPTPQPVDGQVRLVEREFDFCYVKDPVRASIYLFGRLSHPFLGPRE
jgi:hypothetical protein